MGESQGRAVEGRSVVIFEVHGPTAAYRIARHASAAAALAEASLRVYANEKTRAGALARLAEGKDASFGYGFSEVTIYAKGAK